MRAASLKGAAARLAIDIAGILERRKSISAWARILPRVSASWRLPPRCIGVLGDIRAAFSEFDK
jgi:hypothetical protein